MTIRPACEADVQALVAVHAQSFEHEVWDASAMVGLLATPGTFALIDENLSGFIMVRVACDESEILTLAVTPAARRRGVARRLVCDSADRATQAGAASMFLEVNSRNNPAIALYKGLGFQEVGVRKAYYAGPHGMREDALVLRASIPLSRVVNSLQLG